LNKSDILKLTENKSKNQFAIIRYDSEKNNSKNIKLEKVINQKNDWIFFLLFLSLLTLFSSFMWVKYRRKKIKFIAESKVKEERLITSKKVHDVVANGLYQLMSSVENNQDIDKELLLDKLEIMYQKSRDISYNDQLKLSNINIKNQISELGDTFQNENLKVFIVGNEESLWKKISSSIQEDLYIILQELFINTKKHSQATRIVLKFSLEKKQLIINYNDNGICPKDYNLGNGLTHILNRIQQNKGELILPNENVPNSEFKISIIIPVLY
jgi:signal transduction histidine kinase